jgi:AcrR family transcriptional regulator
VGNEALRDKILRAAAELFAGGGYDAASMRQIAERIGYSPTTIYLHFASKDALMFAVVDAAFEELAEALRVAAAGAGSPAERLQAMAWAYVDFGLDKPAYYQLIFTHKPEFLTAPRAEGPPRIEALALLREVTAEITGQDLGQRAPGDFADALWGALHGVASLAGTVPFFGRARALKAADAAIAACIGAMELAAPTAL